SSPREPGTWMLVAPGAAYRTIGGGQLEYMAIDRARAMLRKGSSQDRLDVPLGPKIGPCRGGRVLLRLERIDARIAAQCIAEEVHAHASAPIVHVFGAGHVGRALAAALLLLPVRLVVADSRREEIDRVPAGAERRLTSLPEELIREAPSGS